MDMEALTENKKRPVGETPTVLGHLANGENYNLFFKSYTYLRATPNAPI